MAAVPGGADPRGADDPDAVVAGDTASRLAGVNPHPHAHLGAVRPRVRRKRTLGLGCRKDAVPCALEREEESVTLCIDFFSFVSRERSGCSQMASRFFENSLSQWGMSDAYMKWLSPR